MTNLGFVSVDTIKSKNTSFSQYLQYVDNPTGGYVTITITYTGTLSTFSIPNGALFEVVFKHTSALATTYFSPTDMTFMEVHHFLKLQQINQEMIILYL